MTVLGANLEALAASQPALAAQLASLPPAPDRGEWSLARSGEPTVQVASVRLASAFDPRAEAQKAVPRWGTEVDFALVAGLGAGYLAEAAASLHPDLPLVIADPDPLWVREVLSHRDLRPLLSNPWVVLLVGPAAEVGAWLDQWACRTVDTLTWRPLVQLDPGWSSALAAEVAGAQARGRVNGATSARFAGLWRRNLVRNEAWAPPVRPLAALAGRWDGDPAVIAAAGPSLADRLDWLAAHRGRCVLIAVDTAWPALAARGLVPDILLVLDGQYWNARHVDKEPPEATLVVTEWVGPPRAFRLAPGRTYVAASSLPFLRRREAEVWGDLGTLPTGGSVATAAWSLALHLGCREVAFAGLDLGYPRGQTHVAGSQFEEALHRVSGRLSPAETRGLGLRGLGGLTARPALNGGTVLSDHRMDLFRRWLTAAAEARPDIPAYNLGTRGSVVPGLREPPPDYGRNWPPLAVLPPDSSAPLQPRLPESVPPWAALAEVLTADPFGPAVDRAWAAARDYWGSEVWDRWAGRARATWERFPSSRSRRAVVEAVEWALGWAAFWSPL